MLEGTAPSQIIRNPGYSKALNTRSSKVILLRKGLFALDQMDDIAVAVGEEDQPVTLIVEGVPQKRYALGLQVRVGGIKVVYVDGQVPDARGLHLGRQGIAFRGNDFEHLPVAGRHDIIA